MKNTQIYISLVSNGMPFETFNTIKACSKFLYKIILPHSKIKIIYLFVCVSLWLVSLMLFLPTRIIIFLDLMLCLHIYPMKIFVKIKSELSRFIVCTFVRNYFL